MSDLRTLLEAAEPRDDTGFEPAVRLRSVADRRRRLRTGVTVAGLAAVLVAVPLAVRPGTVETPPAGPTAPVTATPSPSFSLASLAGTEWWVDLRTSGITDDPVAAPTSLGDGNGLMGLGAIVMLDADGGVRLINGYAGAGPLPAGRWHAADPSARTGAVTITLTSSPETWDLDPACTRERCATGALPYWPGVEAFSRLASVVSYELAPIPRGEVMPPVPTMGLSLMDARGDVVLCLSLVARDGTPVVDG